MGGRVEVKNRGGPSADEVLNSRSIGQESAQLPFCWAREKDMEHGNLEPNNKTLSTSLRPPKVTDRKQPSKGLRKEI